MDDDRWYGELDLYLICEECGHPQGVHEFGVGLGERAECCEQGCECRDFK